MGWFFYFFGYLTWKDRKVKVNILSVWIITKSVCETWNLCVPLDIAWRANCGTRAVGWWPVQTLWGNHSLKWYAWFGRIFKSLDGPTCNLTGYCLNLCHWRETTASNPYYSNEWNVFFCKLTVRTHKSTNWSTSNHSYWAKPFSLWLVLGEILRAAVIFGTGITTDFRTKCLISSNTDLIRNSLSRVFCNHSAVKIANGFIANEAPNICCFRWTRNKVFGAMSYDKVRIEKKIKKKNRKTYVISRRVRCNVHAFGEFPAQQTFRNPLPEFFRQERSERGEKSERRLNDANEIQQRSELSVSGDLKRIDWPGRVFVNRRCRAGRPQGAFQALLHIKAGSIAAKSAPGANPRWNNKTNKIVLPVK